MRRKKIRTRKRSALRSLALAVGLLLILQTVFHSFYLVPAQVFRIQKEVQGIQEPMACIGKASMPGRILPERIYFHVCGDVMMLSCARLRLTLWQPGFSTAGCCQDEPLTVGVHMVSDHREHAERCAVLYGRIQDERAASLSIQIPRWKGEIGREETEAEWITTLTREDFLEEDGQTYFFRVVELPPLEEDEGYLTPRAWSCDDQGTVLTEEEAYFQSFG